MVSADELRQIALSFPEAKEEPHFEKTSFRIRKKIFATYDSKTQKACLKLSETDQEIFSFADKTTIYPVNNKWGREGWTLIEIKSVQRNLIKEALAAAYCRVAPKKLAELARKDEIE